LGHGQPLRDRKLKAENRHRIEHSSASNAAQRTYKVY
jgi:hypothetical protein